jgi:fatty-acyl-CoA synthase
MSAWTDLWTGKTIGSALTEATQRFGSREAMVFENGNVTYQQLQETSGLVARGLLSFGIQRGDMVAIWMAGYAEWAYLYYGLARIGAIMVPINTRYKANEVEYVLNKSKARLLIFKDEQRRGKGYFNTLKDLSPEQDQAIPGQFISTRLPYLRQVIAISDRRFLGCSSFKDLLEAGLRVPKETLAQAEAQVQSEDVALLQFTSGTTGSPKGAMLYQLAMLRGAYYNSHRLGVSPQDRFFSAQPFFHVGGSIQIMLAPVVIGCTIIVQSYFDPTDALRILEEQRCTAILGHQPHFIEYLNHPDLKKRRLYLKRGDILAPPDVRWRIYEEMGIEVLISPYSLTETHIGGTTCQFDDPVEKCLNTVGRCMPGMELGIRDPDSNQLLPSGEAGEICFRGWCVMKGYYDDPEMTVEVVDREGWFRTGDLGVVDSDGYLQIVGRIKDMIRVGGENVAAVEIEAFLLQQEKVKQVVVVGAPDPRLGEVAVAFIELKSGIQTTEDEILKYCRSGLASFKVPRKIIFVREWPMSGTGKIQKFLLKESLIK